MYCSRHCGNFRLALAALATAESAALAIAALKIPTRRSHTCTPYKLGDCFEIPDKRCVLSGTTFGRFRLALAALEYMDVRVPVAPGAQTGLRRPNLLRLYFLHNFLPCVSSMVINLWVSQDPG